MSTKTDGIIAIIAAIVVLFSAMFDPRVSLIIAVISLIGLGIYEIRKKAGSVATVVGSKNKQTEEKEREKEAILGLMKTGNEPLTNEHVRMMLGISDATVTRYLDELEKEGKIKQMGKTGAHVFYEKI